MTSVSLMREWKVYCKSCGKRDKANFRKRAQAVVYFSKLNWIVDPEFEFGDLCPTCKANLEAGIKGPKPGVVKPGIAVIDDSYFS